MLVSPRPAQPTFCQDNLWVFSRARKTKFFSPRLELTSHSYAAHVEAHGPLVLKLSNGAPAGPPSFTYYNSASARLSGGAAIRNVNASVSVVGQVGQGSSVTFTGLNAGSVGGGKLLAIDYINADYTFSGDVSCPNCRYAYARVNGGKSIRIQLPISGQVCVIDPRRSLPYT